MGYEIYKLTYADGRAYRYHITDDAGHLCYVAEHAGMLSSSPTRLVEFFDPDYRPAGRLQPPDTAPWRRGTRYEVFSGEEAEEPYAVIQERWRLVDILLLRLPSYEVQLGEYRYIAWGSRYGERFYEIFRPHEVGEEEEKEGEDEGPASEEAGRDVETGGTESRGVKVGQIQRPTAGPSYIVQTDAAPLRQALLVLAALVILIDIELYS